MSSDSTFSKRSFVFVLRTFHICTHCSTSFIRSGTYKKNSIYFKFKTFSYFHNSNLKQKTTKKNCTNSHSYAKSIICNIYIHLSCTFSEITKEKVNYLTYNHHRWHKSAQEPFQSIRLFVRFETKWGKQNKYLKKNKSKIQSMKREYYTTTHTNYMIYKMENKMLFKKKKTNKKYMMINV